MTGYEDVSAPARDDVTFSSHNARPKSTRQRVVIPGEGVWVSWASANLDAAVFDQLEEIRLDGYPNRHASFGLGAHRCPASNITRTAWSTVIGQVLERAPDYEIDERRARRYTRIGNINGWVSVPAAFRPGHRTSAP